MSTATENTVNLNFHNYQEILNVVYFLSCNGSKRHADLISHALECDYGVILSKEQVKRRLNTLRKKGLVSTFTDWIDGEFLGNHWNTTEAGNELVTVARDSRSEAWFLNGF